jgi:hypothetical protein
MRRLKAVKCKSRAATERKEPIGVLVSLRSPPRGKPEPSLQIVETAAFVSNGVSG